ncbi:MAG: ABC transporter permease, partial [Kiritimatiellae bacterium]|nr:ABC transporter permease [Kiritimatiellia bacterium]
RAAMEAISRLVPDFPEVPNLALIATADGTEGAIRALLEAAPPGRPPCRLDGVEGLSKKMRSDAASNLVSSLPMSLCLAALAAACMVATVLLSDLALRRRRIAELRCAGMTRCGVARLVLWESASVAFCGWALGSLVAALALSAFLAVERGDDLPATPSFGWQTPLCGLLLAVVVGLLAAVAPALAALGVKPLEALGPERQRERAGCRGRALAAALLVAPMPAISVAPGLGEKGKAVAMAVLGIPCFAAALLLSARPAVILSERLFLRPVAAALRLPASLLWGRVSRNPSRVAGTVLTVALCLGGFIAIHVWGGTLMASFVPSPEWPDAIVSILPNGWNDAKVGAASRCPGVEDGKVVKIDCTQKPFDADSPVFAERGVEPPPGLVLLFGADPDAAYGGERPFAPFRFVAGEREAAISSMREGRGCVVVAMLARLAKLKVGDHVRFAGRDLEVAGIVDLNWHMVTSRSLVRTSFGREGSRAADGTPPGRTIGAVFVSEKFVREITGNEATYFLWLGMSPELDALGGLGATVALDAQLRAAVADDGLNAVQVHHRDEIADGTLAHGSDILGVMARIPFWSLAVAATGMVALLLASVQGARHELRAMRAIGMTRGQLARLIVGEASLVTAAALLLGFAAGLTAGWSFTGLSRWMVAAGLPVRLIVPWRTIIRGILFALVLCLAMSLLPLSRLVRLVDGEDGGRRSAGAARGCRAVRGEGETARTGKGGRDRG